MSTGLTAYLLILILTGGISLSTSYVAFRHRDQPAGMPLSLLMVAVGEWALAYVPESLAWTVRGKVFWSQVAYLGLVFGPPLLFWFAASFTGQDHRLSRTWLGSLFVIPVLTLILALTNGRHHLIWREVSLIETQSRPIGAYRYGPFFWVMVAHTYVLIAAAALLLIWGVLRFRRHFRRQSLVLVISFLPPLTLNLLYLLKLPIGARDLTPAAFALTGLLLAWSFIDLNLLSLIPVAHEQVLTSMPEGVIVIDPSGSIADFNPAAQALLSLSTSSIGDPIDTLPEAPEIWGNPESASKSDLLPLENGRVIRWQIEELYTPFHKTASPGTLILLRDVTERKTAEAALRTLNATLEAQVAARTAEIQARESQSTTILRSLNEGVVVTDRDLRIRYVNPGFTHITGYPREDVEGQQVYVMLKPESAQMARTLMRGAMQDLERGECWTYELTEKRRNGPEIDVALTGAPMRDEDGAVEGYVFTLQDVTWRNSLSRAQKRFIDTVSHQFRTPVATLKLYLHLMESESLPEREIRRFRAMKDEVDSLEHLIGDVLEVTTLDSGKALARWRPISIPTLLRDAQERYAGKIREKDLSLRILLPSSALPTLRGDIERIAQALNEIIDNAVVFTPTGGKLELEAKVVSTGGANQLHIIVRDTGPGFSPEEQARACDRFYRGDRVEITQNPGTGLGLSIAKAIVEAHGGTLTIGDNSRNGGHGSEVTLAFPLDAHATPPPGNREERL